jgi:MoaA/NifB/PqqE/SkfB family radical SAM enzyme
MGGVASLEWLEPALEGFERVHRHIPFPRPERVGIEVTNACNLDCVMCSTKSSKRPGRLMEFHLFERIVDQIADAGVKMVELYTVGEPFLHPNLEDMVEAAYARGLEVHLSTNAQYPGRLDALLARFAKRPPRLFLSIDGATKTTYEQIRKGATFERALRSLAVVGEHSRRRGDRLPATIRAVLSAANIEELGLFFKVFGEFMRPEDIRFQLINGISLKKGHFHDNVPFKSLTHFKAPCHMPFRNLYFTWDGQATPCARDYDADLVVGDLEKESFWRIWRGERLGAVRARHATGRVDFDPCRDCLDTYRVARVAADEYIHALHTAEPDLPPKEFGARVAGLLWDLDAAVAKGSQGAIRSVVERRWKDLGRQECC